MMDCQALESFQYLTVEGQLFVYSMSRWAERVQESQHTGSVFSQAHTQVVFQWHKITSFPLTEPEGRLP